jgi:DNA polymerase-3 subunit epsilon
MRTLFFDTETSTLPRESLHPSDPGQARLVQFAAILHDAERRERTSVSLLIDPGYQIAPAAAEVHGIDNVSAGLYGISERAAVGVFMRLLNVADVVVGHNISFDFTMMNLAATRAKAELPRPKLCRCTMETSAPIVNLPPTERMIAAGFGDKPKNPKLSEALLALCGEELVGAHDALNDVRACAKLYYALLDRGVWREVA